MGFRSCRRTVRWILLVASWIVGGVGSCVAGAAARRGAHHDDSVGVPL
jgi:hypothetical protein